MNKTLESDVEALAAEVKELRSAIDKIVNLLGQTARDGGDEAYRAARETGERYWQDAKTRADDIVQQIEEKPVQSTLDRARRRPGSRPAVRTPLAPTMAKFLTRLAFGFAAVLIASVAFIAAVSFLFYALFLFFATLMDGPLAALSTSGVLIVFALIVLLIGRGLAGMGGKPRNEQTQEHPLAGVLGRELGSFALTNPIITVGAALVIGVIAGVSPRLRGIFAEMIKPRR